MQRAVAYAAASFVEASCNLDLDFHQVCELETVVERKRVVQGDDDHIRKVAVVVVHIHMAELGSVHSVVAPLEFLVKMNQIKNLYHLIPNLALVYASVLPLVLALALALALALVPVLVQVLVEAAVVLLELASVRED